MALKINKILRPDQVTIIRDNREQAPINLSPLRVVQGTLPTGDFAVAGLEHHIVVERKNLADLVMCVGRERDRFEREVQRLLAYPVRCLVIEACWIDIELHKYRSQISPKAVEGSIISWMSQGLPVHWAGDNLGAGKFISRFLFSAARRRYSESHGFIEAIDFSSTAKLEATA
jgi:DNA excision repair protein ERCC-4